MSEHKRLHPISAVASFVKQLKELIIPFVLIFVLNNNGEKSGFWDYIPILSIVAVLVFVLVAGIVKWLRFTYRLEDRELRIEYGLFVKKKRYIPFDRIQSLNFSEGILHRPFGLVKVKVETAGSSNPRESEAELTAIVKEEALELEKIIYSEKKGREIPETETQDTAEKGKILFNMSPKDIWVLATTSGGIGVILSGVFVFFSQFNELIPYEAVYEEVAVFIKSGIFIVSILSFVLLIVAWLLSIAWTFIIYGEFKVKIVDENIVITRGLLEKKQVTVPLNRVQGIRVVENPIRQLLGYCTVQIENAGGSVLDKESTTIKLFPLVKKKRIADLLDGIFHDYRIVSDFKRLPKRSLKRYVFRRTIWILIPGTIVTILYFPLGALSFLSVIPLSVLGYYQYRAGGWKVDGTQLSLQYRGFLKNTMYMKKNRIQSLDTKESWFQSRKNLGSLVTTVKSGGTGYSSAIHDLERDDIKTVASWFSYNQSI
ncbi:PH domain-containing protein [Rossellomorea aquimaris]|uniref:PH domain-containing protein n=1 Tax=Rossellomorea aquimaris TaxID=189382 RepID=UPI0007D0B715|nr:PH domain-containing protein [Rossellomorea aquimaris]